MPRGPGRCVTATRAPLAAARDEVRARRSPCPTAQLQRSPDNPALHGGPPGTSLPATAPATERPSVHHRKADDNRRSKHETETPGRPEPLRKSRPADLALDLVRHPACLG